MLIPIIKENDSLGPCCGRLQYVVHDYSFSFDYQNQELAKHLAWLCFSPIEIAVSCVNGQLMGASGYGTRRVWADSSSSPIGPIQSRALVFEGFDRCQIGVGYGMEGDEFNRVNFNSTLGWLQSAMIPRRLTRWWNSPRIVARQFVITA